MQNKITPVILSGGSGTRLWPLSTAEKPKQFLAIAGEQSLFQQAALRVKDMSRFKAPLIVANISHIDLIQSQLSDIGIMDYQIIVETAGRNTAPAIALAAFSAGANDTQILVMPSDHIIRDEVAFIASIDSATSKASESWLFTFGLEPTHAETGYGYLKMGQSLGDNRYQVAKFIEKPPLDEAKNMLEDGNYRWNSGIFQMRCDAYLNALEEYAPEIFLHCKIAAEKAKIESLCIFPEKTSFEASPSESIDYAVMEKAEHVAMVSVSMGWSDLGNWDALYEVADKDENANAVAGNTQLIDSQGCYIRSDGAKISVLGIDDLIVISEGQNIVILPRSKAQQVKKLATDS